MLARFISRQPRSSNRSQWSQQSQSQPPKHHINSWPSHWNPEILPVNQANTQEPIYTSIFSVYQIYPSRNVNLILASDNYEHHTPPRYNPYPIPVQLKDLHWYFLNNLYISSILLTWTPWELWYFQDHCWKQYKDPQYPHTHLFLIWTKVDKSLPALFTSKTSFGIMQLSFMTKGYLKSIIGLKETDNLNDPITHALNPPTLSFTLGLALIGL